MGYLTDNLRMKKMKVYILIAMMIVSFNSSAADIGKDKYMHAVASTAISATFKAMNYSEQQAFWYTLGIGLSKEVYDKYSGKGNAEIGDMVANTIGAYIGSKSNFKFTVVRTPFETKKLISYTWKF